MGQGTPLTLDTRRGKIAGLRWPAAGGPRALCLHGWLDNAASFVPMAPHLAGVDVVAVDFPGHGRSAHRAAGSQYHFADYLLDVHAILEALGWERCHLVGHSLGAGVSSLYAAGLPEAVQSLTMLDSLGPWTGLADNAGERLRRSMAQLGRSPREPKRYGSIDEIATARMRAADISGPAARLICERNVKAVGGDYVWRSDAALNRISPVVLSEEHALNCLAGIECPALSVLALPVAKRWSGESGRRRRESMPHCRIEEIDGNHHVHMDRPDTVAGLVRPFLFEHHRTKSLETRDERT